MKLIIVPVTPFQQNCSVLVDESTMRAVAIDPGGDLDRIDAALAEHNRPSTSTVRPKT